MATLAHLRRYVAPFVLILVGGCADETTSSDEDAITGVAQSSVKYQAGGNCWVYANVGWAESLHIRATNQEVDLSETYMTYWELYDRITSSGVRRIGDLFKKDVGKFEVDADGIITLAGAWSDAVNVVRDRGHMLDADFTPQDGAANKNSTVPKAKELITESLLRGALAERRARRDHRLVRDELDKAFGLSLTVTGRLDALFGDDGDRLSKDISDAEAAVNKLILARNFQVGVPTPGNGTETRVTTLEAVTTGGEAWKPAPYSSKLSEAERRNYVRRVQRALHDHAPVVLTWYVDRAARDSYTYRLSKLTAANANKAPDGHALVIDDYQAILKDGTVLKAGVLETNPTKLQAALEEETKVDFFRVKNSWGPLYNNPGYFDIELDRKSVV